MSLQLWVVGAVEHSFTKVGGDDALKVAVEAGDAKEIAFGIVYDVRFSFRYE